jgi:hypothetical protein
VVPYVKVVELGLNIKVAKYTVLKDVHMESHEQSLDLLEFYMLLQIEDCRVISELNAAPFPCAEIICEGLNDVFPMAVGGKRRF